LDEARALFPDVAEVTADGMRTLSIPQGIDEYAREALQGVVEGHRELVNAIQEMGCEHGHTAQAVNMLRICAARRFGYQTRIASPVHTVGPARAADEMLIEAVAELIQDQAERRDRPHWADRMQLPQAYGGGGFGCAEQEAPLAHMASWGACLRPMIDRYEGAEGEHVHPVMRRVAAELRRAGTSELSWAVGLRGVVDHVTRQMEWTEEDLGVYKSFFQLAPTQPGVEVAGARRPARRETSGEDEEEMFQMPTLDDMVQEEHRGMQHQLGRALARRRCVAAWRRRSPVERARMLACGGMAGGAFMVSTAHGIPDALYPTAVRHLLGCREPLAAGLTSCPECKIRMTEDELRDHVVRCPSMNRGRAGSTRTANLLFHYHRVMVDLLEEIAREVGVTTILEMPALLAGTAERPADIACISVEGAGRHWIIDFSLVHVLSSTYIDRGRASREAGYAARVMEDHKIKHYHRRVEALGHRFIPFVMEDGGRMGQHAAALLREFAVLRADRSRRTDDWESSRAVVQERYYTQWIQRISSRLHAGMATWIQLSLTRARERVGGSPTHM